MQGARSSGADEAAPVEFDRAHSELLADRDIQFELPVEPPPTRREVQLPSGGGFDGGPLAQVLFWVAVVLAAAGLLYLIASRVTGWQRRGRDEAAADDGWQIGEEPARRLLGDADALAAEGRYAEAVHLLLHRSIEEIDRRRPATVRKALTSRDIAASPVLPAGPAAAFAAIVGAVERSLFARRALGAEDWAECRGAYQRFAFAGAWQR